MLEGYSNASVIKVSGSSHLPVRLPSKTTPSLLTPVARIRARSNAGNSLRSRRRNNGTHSIDIKRIVRPMRGGTQARLVEGADGRFYVAKFAGNPQGNRTLINEWITQFILSHLGISTPPLRILRLPEQLRNEDLYFSVGNRRIPVEGEWHLGSLCPVNPETHVIFDFLPVKFLQNVSNLDDFASATSAKQSSFETAARWKGNPNFRHIS
jgi:hypothetical protein